MELRSIEDGEIDAFRACMLETFGGDVDQDPDGSARFRALIPPGRAWAAFDRGRVVATAASFALEVGIPGGTLPMAGLTMVTVRPTHRRQGILRKLIALHLADARTHGEPISGLWASEATIYGRFGYGIAAEEDQLAIEWSGTRIAELGGLDRCELVPEAEARELLPPIYARATADRPGALRRTAAWWHERRFLEAPYFRNGGSRRRHVIAWRDDIAVGYVAYRHRGGALDTGNRVDLIELVAGDPRAEASLWRFIAGIDLYPNASLVHSPVDAALPWIISDPRRVKRSRADTLWLRVEDVARAFEARRYASAGTLVFGLEGAAWELVVEDGGSATCRLTTASPVLELADRAALGSLFLGGITASTLARAGRITPRVATWAADRLFAWPVAPWCPEVF